MTRDGQENKFEYFEDFEEVGEGVWVWWMAGGREEHNSSFSRNSSISRGWVRGNEVWSKGITAVVRRRGAVKVYLGPIRVCLSEL